MTQTSMRLLTLLSLLQSEPHRSGAELAERLRVSRRTVRNDIDRLRECGYAIDGVRGSGGGYRLGFGGTAVPPLMLDADEAIAVAIGLHAGVNCIIGGMEEVSLGALSKLERMLPSQARRNVRNLGHFVVPMPTENAEPVPIVDPSLLTMLAGICESNELLRFEYLLDGPRVEQRTDRRPAEQRSGAGPPPTTPRPATAQPVRRATPLPVPSRYEVEPYLLINRIHRWYLLAYDPDRSEWAVFEVYGIRPRTPAVGGRYTPRPLPAEDMHAYVSRRLPGNVWKVEATVTVELPAERVRTLVAPAEGEVTALDARRCTLRVGGETAAAVAGVLVRLDADFTVEGPPESIRYLAQLAARFDRGSVGPAKGAAARPGDSVGTPSDGIRARDGDAEPTPG